MIIVRPEPAAADIRQLMLHPNTVWPKRYQSKAARRDAASKIAVGNGDDVLASHLWVIEGQLAKEALDTIHNEVKWVQETRGEVDQLLRSANPFGREWLYTREELEAALRILQRNVDITHRRCHGLKERASAAFYALRERFGRPPQECFQDSDDDKSFIDEIYISMKECVKLVDTLEKSVDNFIATRTAIAEIEQKRAAFVTSGHSIDDRHISVCDGPGFEELTSQIMQRDGLTVLRRGGGSGDHGADIIALTPQGRRIVAQCKLRRGKPIGPDVVYQVNGTARQFHNADIPLIVTTSSFSEQATDCAASQEIHLIDARRFRMWATWGENLLDVLGISEHTDTANEVPLVATGSG